MQIPTGRDIYIEIDGNRVAVVQSYQCYTQKQSQSVEAFGQVDPVATVAGKVTYQIKLKKVLPIGATSTLDVYSLSDFILTLVKPDERVVYSGCQWESITESGDVSTPCYEEISVLATRRMVL